MKRKTHLFYTDGQDSNFITFSNYTESLTGNFLSTDTKLFPSRFMALNIENLTETSKKLLIKYLVDYYESKLAVLRDHFSNNRSDIETRVSPLNYLLEALFRIEKLTDNKISFKHSIKNNSSVKYNDDYATNSDVISFKFISDITEQDYNGTFTDTICNIDLNDITYISSVVLNNDIDNNIVQFDSKTTTLYGWDNNNIPTYYKNEHSIPDSIDGLDIDKYFVEDIDNNTISISGNSVGTFEYNQEIAEEEAYAALPADDINITNDIVNTNNYVVNSSTTVSLDAYSDEIKNTDTSDFAKSLSDSLQQASKSENNSQLLKDIRHELENSEDNFVILINKNTDTSEEMYKYDGADVTKVDTSLLEYRIDPEIIGINLTRDNSNINEITFNCIIPLYDIVDINYKSNFNTVDRIITDDSGNIDTEPSSTNKMYCHDVPLGMWLSVYPITLHKDSQFAQSWSLTISSQFKPFPYSSKMPEELTIYNKNTNAYMTFAQVLASQASMIRKFSEMEKLYADMSNKISHLQSQLSNIGTSYNIDNIHREFNDYRIEMRNNFNELQNNVTEQLSYLRWHTSL